jgi:hypothetical protein
MIRKSARLFGLLCSLTAVACFAHPDWYLARLKPPNGGQLRNAANFHMELVVDASEIRLYVSDHFFNKFPTKASSATAVLVSGDQVLKVRLEPGGDNLLKAQGNFPQEVNLKVGILLEAHRYGPVAARFTPFQKLNELAPPAQRIDPAQSGESLPEPPEALR